MSKIFRNLISIVENRQPITEANQNPVFFGTYVDMMKDFRGLMGAAIEAQNLSEFQNLVSSIHSAASTMQYLILSNHQNPEYLPILKAIAEDCFDISTIDDAKNLVDNLDLFFTKVDRMNTPSYLN